MNERILVAYFFCPYFLLAFSFSLSFKYACAQSKCDQQFWLIVVRLRRYRRRTRLRKYDIAILSFELDICFCNTHIYVPLMASSNCIVKQSGCVLSVRTCRYSYHVTATIGSRAMSLRDYSVVEMRGRDKECIVYVCFHAVCVSTCKAGIFRAENGRARGIICT